MKPSYGVWPALPVCLLACAGQYNLDLLAKQMTLGRNLTQEAGNGGIRAYATTAATAKQSEQLACVRELQNGLAAKQSHTVLSGGSGASSLVCIEALAALAQSQKSLAGRTVIRVEMVNFVKSARELGLTPSQFLDLFKQVFAQYVQKTSSPIFVLVVEEVPTLEELRRLSGFAGDGLLETGFDQRLLNTVGTLGYPAIWVLGESNKQSARPLHQLLRNQPRVEVGDLSAAQLYLLLNGEKKGRGILLADDLLQMIVRVLSAHGGDQGLLELGLRVMDAVSEELEQNPKMTWRQQRALCLRSLAPFLQTTVAALEQSRAVTWTGTLPEFASDQLLDPSAYQLIKLGPGELASLKVSLRTRILHTSQNLRRLLLNLPNSVSDVLLQTMRDDLKAIDAAVQDILPTVRKSNSEDRNIARTMASSLRELADEFDKKRSIKDRIPDEVDRLKTANIAKLDSFVR